MSVHTNSLIPKVKVVFLTLTLQYPWFGALHLLIAPWVNSTQPKSNKKKWGWGGVIFYWVNKLNNLIEIEKSSSGTEQLLQLVCGPAFWLPALPDRELQGTRKIQAEEKNSIAFSYLQGRTWYLFFHLLCDFVAWYSWVFSEKSALLSETKAKKL